jgi:hypothetical protein
MLHYGTESCVLFDVAPYIFFYSSSEIRKRHASREATMTAPNQRNSVDTIDVCKLCVPQVNPIRTHCIRGIAVLSQHLQTMAETKQKPYNGKFLGDTSSHLLLPREVPSTFRRYSTESGTDVKSVTINMASTLLIVLPFACYARREQCWLYIGVVAISFLISFLLYHNGNDAV